MTHQVYIRFEGLDAPVLLDRCEELLTPMRKILPGWSFETSPDPSGTDPIATISPAGSGRYACVTVSSCGSSRTFNSVNAICDMIVELSWEQLRTGQFLMCLHGAAIEMAGRLVIVPNVRRAGKSTLTACLAHRGFRVFSDDFFSVDLDSAGRFQGHAAGICPRLRLPLPEDFSAGFRNWVAQNDAPANRQYKYLTLPDLPRHGEAAPLGAIVVLDRRTEGPVTMSRMDEAKALDGLLHQNFARSVHSGTILHAAKALFAAIKPYRLTYSSAEEAADHLQDAFRDWPEDIPVVQDRTLLEFREVDEEHLQADLPKFLRDQAYGREEGFSEVSMNGGFYLTDTFGLGIHRLNDGSLAIWRLLEEPMRLAEVCDVLCAAFPDVPCEQIEQDSEKIMRHFVETRLITKSDKTI